MPCTKIQSVELVTSWLLMLLPSPPHHVSAKTDEAKAASEAIRLDIAVLNLSLPLLLSLLLPSP